MYLYARSRYTPCNWPKRILYMHIIYNIQVYDVNMQTIRLLEDDCVGLLVHRRQIELCAVFCQWSFDVLVKPFVSVPKENLYIIIFLDIYCICIEINKSDLIHFFFQYSSEMIILIAFLEIFWIKITPFLEEKHYYWAPDLIFLGIFAVALAFVNRPYFELQC